MNKNIYKFLISLFCFVALSFSVTASYAQFDLDPVSWSISKNKVSDNVYEVILTPTIEENWHIYDFGPYNDGPNATVLSIKGDGIKLIGKPYIKGNVKKEYDETFKMNIGTIHNGVSLAQKVEVVGNQEVNVIANVEWQACTTGNCIPPQDVDLSIKLPAVENKKEITQPSDTLIETVASQAINEDINTTDTDGSQAADIDKDTEALSELNDVPANTTATKSIWGFILEAIGWGLLALLTPCVFPMLPMTVSFFLKQSEKQPTKGKFMAILYGICIVLIYTIPIAILILLTYLIGGGSVTADIFNWLATNWIPNVIFFIIFILFALSFFGAFEITLPSSMVNNADSKSNKGGLIGVFFMALTLVLVSFSCTGPIVGTVLIKSTQGEVWTPIIVMLVFSIVFAIPFTLFAFAPSLLKNLKSGGWLNSVKVVLGFIELALGMKFLSVADQTYHWGILDREVYLAFWIVIFSLLGFYLLGKLRFKYDSPQEHISVFKLILAIIDFAFVVYMIPGMWGAPLKALSGYLPPIQTQDFVVTHTAGNSIGSVNGLYKIDAQMEDVPRKYSDLLHLPHGITGYFTYNEALEASKREGKPIFFDFTGHGCVNCREMEARVWSDPEVLKMLKEDFIVCSLFGDDKTTVAEEDFLTLPNGKVLKDLGKINSRFVLDKFNVNAQPFYIILDSDGEPIAPSMGYNLNVDEYKSFLQKGLSAYKVK